VNDRPGTLALVTGASGFAGSHLVDLLLSRQPHVAAWTHRAPAAPADPRISWQRVDLLDKAATLAAVREARPALIYHCAGLPHVAESWKDAAEPLAVNVLGTHHLLEAVRDSAPACKVVVVGSALVYRQSEQALREDDPIGPSSPYGVSKLAQEMLAWRASTPTVIARPFNHAGPRQQASFVTSSFAKQIAQIEAGLADPCLRVGNLDARRDITDVRDTVRAYAALGEAGAGGEVYNVCAGVAYRIGDLLEILLKRARTRISVAVDPERLRPSDNPVVLGDPSRIRRTTGWEPQIPVEQTLEDLLDWWRGTIARRAS
jgi:GDP-4-dehydro-6-deoxy-D-mannose reductase